MLKKRTVQLSVLWGVCLIFLLTVFSPGLSAEQMESLPEMQEKLAGISEEEKEILQHLFVLSQEVEEMEREKGKIEDEIQSIKQGIKGMEEAIQQEEAAFQAKQEVLRQVLESYQRMGPGSYLEIVLSADNLRTLVRRLSALRDITRNTGKVLEELEESRERLSKEKEKRIEMLAEIEEKQSQLEEALAKRLRVIDEKEQYLASLESEREYYQEHLDNLQQVWNDLQILFSEAAKEFVRIIEEEDFPPNALQISFSLFRVKGTIEENTFNEIMVSNSKLSRMIFGFSPERLTIEVPDSNLVLMGTCKIEEGHTLLFEIEEGSFYGIVLEPEAVRELFRDGYIRLSFRSMIGNGTLNSVEILDGRLEFQMRLSF